MQIRFSHLILRGSRNLAEELSISIDKFEVQLTLSNGLLE